MHIHFVCTGNTFRSRLAEAIFNSYGNEVHTSSSSGVHAQKNLNGPIAWYAARLIRNYDLISHMSSSWSQTTKEILGRADKVIFMTDYHFQMCRDELNFTGQNYEIWNIEDIQNTGKESIEEELEMIKTSEKIFEKIKTDVDKLLAGL